MNVYRITLEEIATGRTAPSMVTRQASEADAREYAEAAIRSQGKQNDLRVASVEIRK